MEALCREVAGHTEFILSDIPPVYHLAVRELGYNETANKLQFLRTLPTSTPFLESICDNFRLHAEEMILQTARVRPVPWEKALRSFVELVEPHKLDWWLGGSAALAVRGLEVAPRDFDVVISERDAELLGSVLQAYLIEPVTPVDWFCSRWGRAFLYARVEWVGGVNEHADQPTVSDFGPTAAGRLETVTWRGRPIRVPPLDLQLDVSRRRGLTDRVEQIERALENT